MKLRTTLLREKERGIYTCFYGAVIDLLIGLRAIYGRRRPEVVFDG
jgi:hypothetical protein